MSSNDGEGLLWLVAIGLGLWGWQTQSKLKDERQERIDAMQKAEFRRLALETRIDALETKLDETKRDIGLTSAAVGAVSEQVSNNAKVANDNALADMTEKGMCGRETVRYADGGWSVRNKQCTLKDLRK